MTKQLYLIEYESSQWCSGQSRVVVWANDPECAQLEADLFMEESMRELFSTEYDEDLADGGNLDEDCAYTINSTEPFGPHHSEWQWYLDPVQRANFYPTLGEPE